MKVIAVLALLSSFYGSTLSRRFQPSNTWNELSEVSNDLSMDSVQSAANDQSDFSGVMDAVKAKLETATDQTMSHLNAILMLKESSTVSEGLRYKIEEFKESLVQHLERDLFKVVKEFKNERSVQGPLTDDEKYAFSDLLKSTWEETLTTDLEAFQQGSLPRWVSSVRNVWKGIEKKVMAKIDRFKKFVHKTTPRTSDTCALPKSILVGSNAISSASQRIQKIPMQRMDTSASEVFGMTAIFILTVIGVVVLAAGAPFYVALIGVVVLVFASPFFYESYAD